MSPLIIISKIHIVIAVQNPDDVLYSYLWPFEQRSRALESIWNPPPHHKVRTSLSYVILEFCRIASSTRFLFRSVSHNVQLCLLDNKPNNSSRRGCHGYGNRSDAPHLSLVTEGGSVGTNVWQCLVFAGRFYQSHSIVTMIYLLKEVIKNNFPESSLRRTCFLICSCFRFPLFSLYLYSLLSFPSNQINTNAFRLTE